MILLAIDPGSTESAFVAYNSATGGIRNAGKQSNEWLLAQIRSGLDAEVACVVIEKVESYGMPVGVEIFDTVYWSGKFAEAADPLPVHRLGRKAVKLHLCQSMRAKDSNIRRALMDRYGGDVSIKKGNALHGIAGDVWAALACAVTWADQQ